MPPPLDVNKEEVRMLVISVGVREAARQMGLSENTVLAWANRGGWIQALTDARERKNMSMQSRAIVKPVDALKNVLTEHSVQTRLSLAVAARNMAKTAETADLSEAPSALATGKLASLLHGWDKQSQAIRISVFAQTVSMDEAMPYAEAIDISDDEAQGDPAFT